jgi:hypothetical protein
MDNPLHWTRRKPGRTLISRLTMGYRSTLAIILVIIGLGVADTMLNRGAAGIFLAGKLADLIEYLAVWR